MADAEAFVVLPSAMHPSALMRGLLPVLGACLLLPAPVPPAAAQTAAAAEDQPAAAESPAAAPVGADPASASPAPAPTRQESVAPAQAAPAASQTTPAAQSAPALSAKEKTLLEKIRALKAPRWRSYGACRYDWTLWRLAPDGVRTTSVQCGKAEIPETVAVHCDTFKLSYRQADQPWSTWRLPFSLEESSSRGGEDLMVAALCANVQPQAAPVAQPPAGTKPTTAKPTTAKPTTTKPTATSGAKPAGTSSRPPVSTPR